MPHRSLRLVRDGQPPSPSTPLDAVYRAHARYVATLALRVLGRDSDVDDVVHDVFVAAARGLDALRDVQAMRGWLGVVTVRVARRRLGTRRLLSLFGLEPETDYGELASPDASPDQRAQVAQLYRVLDALPAAERLAWALRHIEGEPLDEVARLCGCSLATVKRRITAAQQLIDRRLGDE
jgi:RNA polymerase sigma-70 factor (ECF subfamily)